MLYVLCMSCCEAQKLPESLAEYQLAKKEIPIFVVMKRFYV
jgi:hypothetical protein